MAAKTTLDKIIENLNHIRVWIQSEGGDVVFKSFDKGILTLLVSGHCVGCASFDSTYTFGIKSLLMEQFPEIKDVVFELKKVL